VLAGAIQEVKDMALNKAVETAIRMETDAMKFYREAVSKTSHPFGKRLFQGFVSDEMRHLKALQDIMNDLDIELKEVPPRENIKTIFSELKDQMMERVRATTDEMEAVKIALDFEKEGYEFYVKAAESAYDEKEKKLFERLSGEEKRHYRLLENTHRFLQDTGDWFMWEEHGILEG
jgi:rubrerythrin